MTAVLTDTGGQAQIDVPRGELAASRSAASAERDRRRFGGPLRPKRGYSELIPESMTSRPEMPAAPAEQEGCPEAAASVHRGQ